MLMEETGGGGGLGLPFLLSVDLYMPAIIHERRSNGCG